MEAHNNTNKNDLKNSQVAVVMVPFPAHGHTNQLLYLSHLLLSYNLPVFFTGSSTHNHLSRVRIHDPDTSTKIHFIDFPLPHLKHLPPSNNDTTNFPTHLQPVFFSTPVLGRPVSNLLQELSSKFRRVVIHDNLMSSVVQDVKSIPNAEAYAFLSVSAFTIFFNKWRSLKEKPFELDDDYDLLMVPSREGCFTPEFEEFIANQHKVLGFESGRIYNTSRVIEGKFVELLEKLPSNSNKKQFAIGPFNPVLEQNPKTRHLCLEWLEKQGKGSVLYVSFGTMTSLSDEQIEELATGLERSDQKFIWVVRFCNDDQDSRRAKLPEGYEERVKNRGMVVRDWAPQLEILGHSSTGGFVSHCGWNSCLESIAMGVPMVAWPMHSDQPCNSVLVTRVLRIGVLIRDWENRGDIVRSESIENVVRRLMDSEEGEEMRRRAKELGGIVRESLGEGGASRLELESFVDHITR